MSRRNFEAVMDTVYAVIHVEYVFIGHIQIIHIYILHKYWMRNSISPFYDVASSGVEAAHEVRRAGAAHHSLC